MESAAAQIPGARTLTLPDAGHLAPMERPESLAQLIIAFLGETE
jgi:pimeloyl-ACP methyl ester carboxylesterase